MKSWNLDKLPDDAKALIALCFDRLPVGWTKCYMIEVRLDNPVDNIMFGGHGLETHGGNGSRCYAKHYDDPAWAVVHIEDEDWLSTPKEGWIDHAVEILAGVE